MEECLKYILIVHLRKVGFDAVTRRALNLFYLSTTCTIKNYLRTLKSITLHSQRSKTTVLDILKLQTFFKEQFIPLKVAHRLSLITVKPIKILEDREEGKRITDSLLGTTIDRYVHVYDFMPKFPPAHTFRKSFAKESEEEEKSKNIKRRLEESLIAENNLVKMMDASNDVPSFVNFMVIRK